MSNLRQLIQGTRVVSALPTSNPDVSAPRHITLSEIEIDPHWNVRLDGTSSGGPDEDHDFEMLRKSIGLNGQDEPVVVRPHPHPREGRPAYSLVAGFRRARAVVENAREVRNNKPTILAVVRELDEEEARNLNLRENTARDNLSPPDVALGLVRLRNAMGGKPTAQMIADSVGLSSAYTSSLLRIMTKIRTSVTEAWRTAPIQLSVNDMLTLVDVRPEDQEARYQELLRGKAARETGTGEGSERRQRTGWFEGCKEKARNVGKMFGKLVRDGQCKLAEGFFADNIRVVMAVPDRATHRQVQELAREAQEAFDEEIIPPMYESTT